MGSRQSITDTIDRRDICLARGNHLHRAEMAAGAYRLGKEPAIAGERCKHRLQGKHARQGIIGVVGAPGAGQRGRVIHIAVGIHDDMVKLSVSAAPVDGKANKAVIAYLAKFLHIPKKEVQIVSGEKSRKKHCVIGCLSEKDVREKIEKNLVNERL